MSTLHNQQKDHIISNAEIKFLFSLISSIRFFFEFLLFFSHGSINPHQWTNKIMPCLVAENSQQKELNQNPPRKDPNQTVWHSWNHKQRKHWFEIPFLPFFFYFFSHIFPAIKLSIIPQNTEIYIHLQKAPFIGDRWKQSTLNKHPQNTCTFNFNEK